MSASCVYLIKGGPGVGPGTIMVKLGRTLRRPEERLTQLQTGNPWPLHVLVEIRCGDAIREEWFLHRFLKACGYHHHQEWYSFPESLVQRLEARYGIKVEPVEREAPRA